ncbi:MAG: sugar phosphate isomerase/epimerase family protein [Planctomycetota bacterium]
MELSIPEQNAPVFDWLKSLANVRTAIHLGCLKQPFKKALQTASRLGAQGVEIDVRSMLRPEELSDTGRRQLKKMMSDLNLKVAGIRFPTRRGYDVVQDLERRIDATKSAMSFAYSLGASVVINAVGEVPEDVECAEYAQLKASLSDLASYGAHIGAMLACETGSEPVERLAGLLGSLSEQAIGIAFNPGNLIINDYLQDDSIRQAASWTLAVIARDGVRDLARGRGLEVPLGQGSAEIPEILGVLEERRYDGWFHLEASDSVHAAAELSNAIAFLGEL